MSPKWTLLIGSSAMICLKNAEPVDSIGILDRAFHYGDGCFTTARLFNDCFELQPRHYSRLKTSAERLSLVVDLSLIEQSLALLRQTQACLNGTLKIIISRGEGQRGYSLPQHSADLYVLFFAQKLSSFELQIIESGTLDLAIGLSMPDLVGIKSLNRLEQVLLKQQADKNKWIEALVTDVRGGVVEGVSSNCFFKINNTWITPELGYNGVHGVMRGEILSRMQQNNVACLQRYVDIIEIPHIESLFFCNALSPMKAVEQFNETLLDVQPCVELFNTLRLNQMHDYV